jgi:hypothetical protein
MNHHCLNAPRIDPPSSSELTQAAPSITDLLNKESDRLYANIRECYRKGSRYEGLVDVLRVKVYEPGAGNVIVENNPHNL